PTRRGSVALNELFASPMNRWSYSTPKDQFGAKPYSHPTPTVPPQRVALAEANSKPVSVSRMLKLGKWTVCWTKLGFAAIALLLGRSFPEVMCPPLMRYCSSCSMSSGDIDFVSRRHLTMHLEGGENYLSSERDGRHEEAYCSAWLAPIRLTWRNHRWIRTMRTFPC